MKFEILINILFDILSNKNTSAPHLAEKYDLSKRTIYRYIKCLENAGVPIYSLPGRHGGGFSIVDTYRLSSSFMTVAEFEQTIQALTSITNSVPDKTLSSALNKLKAAVKNEYGKLDIQSGSLLIDAGPWGNTLGYKSKLAVLKRSIEETRRLFIRYHDRNGEVTERFIDPHIIVFKQGLWYIYAFCHLRNEFRFFKLGRIENATVTEEKFTKQNLSEQDLPLDFWNNNLVADRIELQIEKSVLSDVEEWLGIENIEKIGENFIASAPLAIDNGLVSKIMSFGGGVKVVSPEKLQIMIKDAAEKIIRSYNQDGNKSRDL